MPQVLGQLGLQVGEQPRKSARPRTYRLRHGKAVLLETNGPKMRDAFSGHEVPQMLMYAQNETITTSEDLLALNTPGMEPKFELIGSHGEGIPVGGLEAMSDMEIEAYLRHRREQPSEDQLQSVQGSYVRAKTPETMTVEELYQLAADEEIDLPPNLSQVEAAKAIRRAAGYTVKDDAPKSPSAATPKEQTAPSAASQTKGSSKK